MNLISKQTKGVVSLVLLALGFALIAVSVRYISLQLSLFQQLYFSAIIAFVFHCLIFGFKLTPKKLKIIPSKDWKIIFFRVIAGSLIGASLYRKAILLTKVSNVSFIQSIPFEAVFGFLLFSEKPTLKKILFLISAYIGVILISIKDFYSIVEFVFGRGELFSLISSALFALSFLSRRWMTDKLNDKEISQLLLLGSFIILFLSSMLTGEVFPVVGWHLLIIVAIIFNGFINAIVTLLINYGFANVRPVLASNILTLEGVFTLILGLMIFREFPNFIELSGGIVIIASVIMMNNLERKQQEMILPKDELGS